ncbi:hypothetical protein SRHO_G00104490 [Serrasalmus rhombeus]
MPSGPKPTPPANQGHQVDVVGLVLGLDPWEPLWFGQTSAGRSISASRQSQAANGLKELQSSRQALKSEHHHSSRLVGAEQKELQTLSCPVSLKPALHPPRPAPRQWDSARAARKAPCFPLPNFPAMFPGEEGRYGDGVH